jgi:hypothetical protein
MMKLTIVNSHPRYAQLQMAEPPLTGYVHLAAVVETTVGPTPIPRRSPRKRRLLAELKVLAAGLARLDTVTKATVYRAALVPPPSREARHAVTRPARYDVAVLVETPTVAVLDQVQAAPQYHQLENALRSAARDLLVMPAHCARMVADVEKTRQGLFLFNYFVAADPRVALRLWEHLAGWYAAQTGMDNSTLLAPLGDSDYVFVNHARWDLNLPEFAVRQFAKPSFRSYVLANLRANHTASMPILYTLA